ncbi:MAG TPA: hypothetical protein VGE30_02455 [Candidatus Saccharimonadales bacterium]
MTHETPKFETNPEAPDFSTQADMLILMLTGVQPPVGPDTESLL